LPAAIRPLNIVVVAVRVSHPDCRSFSPRLSRNRRRCDLAGTPEKAAHEAGDLCEKGPHLTKPYEPSQVVDWIKKLRNLNSPK
jgi:hypothetical protein